MSDVYRIAAIGMLEGRQRLEAAAVNAASASVPGYRRQLAVGRAFGPELLVGAAAPVGHGPNGIAAMQASLPLVDLKRGALIATGRALDLAIEDDDLFFALTDGTRVWLTRAGSFRVDAYGVLRGERGLRVVGAQGDVLLPGSDVEVTSDGRIMREDMTVATLQLFRPNDRASLLPAQGALLEASAGIEPAQAAARVRSGTLEASNSDATREMLDLLSLNRQFESLTRVMQGYDELLGRTIQKLSEG